MLFLIVLSAALALANATPGYLGAGVVGAPAYSAYAAPAYAAYAAPAYAAYAAPAYAAYAAPATVSSQYHAQDELGQYSYGYSGDTSAKQETRTLDGITRGGYSYVDGHGLVQSASYVSDPINGFRVAATNLPVGPAAPAPAVAAYAAPAVHAAYGAHGIAAYGTHHLVDPVAIAAGAPLPVGDTVEVAAAKAAHFQAHVDAKHNLLGRKKRSPGYLGAGVAAYAAPAVAAYAAPVAVAAPARSFAYSTVAAHASPVVAAYAAPVAVAAPARSFAYSTVAAHASPVVAAYAAPAVHAYAAPAVHAYAAPVVHAYAAPAVAAYAAPVAHAVVSDSSQYQAQDTLGQYSYGYSDSNSAKHETRAFDGTTHGGYSYVDGNGLVQSVKYHADALGFRAHGTNFPVAA